MPIDYLSQFDLLQIRTRLAAQQHTQFDLLNLDGLQSALATPRQSMFGEDLFPTVWDKAAVLLSLLIRNHPFYDGNKRIATIAVTEFLQRNGWQFVINPAEAETFTTSIAADHVQPPEIMAWLQQHAQSNNEADQD